MAEQAWNVSSAEGSETVTQDNLVHGLSGSPGIARGLLKIINKPEEFDKLQKGEVLVCRFTDPVWCCKGSASAINRHVSKF